MGRRISALLLAFAAASCGTQAGEPARTVRICDASGCSEQPREASSFNPSRDDNPEEARRLAALTQVARGDARAAFDLGLRYFRGDGVRRDSYHALMWTRDAAERGHVPAQLALGRLYLSGLEEMGADPLEAEKWLSLAASRGDKEAARLLTDAKTASRSEQALYQWREQQRKNAMNWWASGYGYHWVWGPAGWIYR